MRHSPTHRTAIKSTGVFAFPIALGLVTQSQAQAAGGSRQLPAQGHVQRLRVAEPLPVLQVLGLRGRGEVDREQVRVPHRRRRHCLIERVH
ncbi:MAG: hypothetical protein U5L74_07520 [Ideonella sp.]|nr:hypothetical protein [Ideonella sp.]